MSHVLSRFRFRLYYWPRWLVELPFPAIICPICRRTALSGYRGISICQASFSRFSSKKFLESTLEVLKLIERVDPRRFRRIQKHVRFIVHSELASGACYKRLARWCAIDYSRYDFTEDQDWSLLSYASALVHEATHGEIFSRYIISSARTRVRIEKLCHTEERRFLRHLDTPQRS